jgi:hypothetical protein
VLVDGIELVVEGVDDVLGFDEGEVLLVAVGDEELEVDVLLEGELDEDEDDEDELDEELDVWLDSWDDCCCGVIVQAVAIRASGTHAQDNSNLLNFIIFMP